MKSKYSHTIYTVTRVKTNSLYVVNNKGEEQKVKKSDVKIIKEVDNYKTDDIIKIVDKEHKVKQKQLRAKVDEKDIVESKRVKKPNQKYL